MQCKEDPVNATGVRSHKPVLNLDVTPVERSGV